MIIRVTSFESDLGRVLVSASEVGLQSVRIGEDEDRLRAELAAELGAVEPVEDAEGLAEARRALGLLAEGRSPRTPPTLDLRGSAFQRDVWSAIAAIPRGRVRTYADLAGDLGRPSAVRAVARGCATNPVALVIPCHRVVRTDGGLGGYRWGLEVKRRLLELEGAPLSGCAAAARTPPAGTGAPTPRT